MDRQARPRRDNFEEEDPFAVGFPDIEGVDDGHFKTSVFLLSTEIRNSWWMEGLLCPSCLVCAIMGEAPMNLACLWILQVFALEMDVSEVHLVNLQYICFTGEDVCSSPDVHTEITNSPL